jgi:PAS domain S-box-containing protein
MFGHQDIRAQGFATELYGVEIGLPTYFTKAVTQTPDRVLWIATDAGLVRFNSRDVTVYQQELASPYVKNVQFIDGQLFVISDGGIQKLNSKEPLPSFSMVKAAGTDPVDTLLYYPKALYKDRKGDFWVVEANGVNRLRNGKTKRFAFPARFLDTDTYVATQFMLERDSALFVLSQRGFVQRFDPETDRFEESPFSGDGLRPVIRSVVRMPDGGIIAGGETGLIRIRPEENGFRWTYLNTALNVTALAVSESGSLFVATKNEGIFLLPHGGNKPLPIAALNNIGLNSLFLDLDDNLWASCDQGFALVQPRLFQHIAYPQLYQFTNMLTAGDDGTAWVASESAVFSIKAETSGRVEVKQELQTAPSKNLSVFAASGPVLVANSMGVLLEQRGNRFVQSAIPVQDALQQAHIYYMDKAPDGSLWFLMYNLDGVYRRFPDGTVKHYAKQEGIEGKINVVGFSPEGVLYAAGNGNASFLYRFNQSRDVFENLSTPVPRQREAIINIHDLDFDASGKLWMVGNEGLLIRDENGIRQAEGQQELRYELFSAVSATSGDDVWVGAQNGVYLYRNGMFTLFTNRDGLPSLTVNFRCLRVDRFDRVWVGTINGLAFLDRPVSLLEPTQKPFITGLAVNGKPVLSFSKGITAPENATVEVQFLAIGFPADKMEYQTRLAGRTGNWQKLQTVDRVLYTQLKPGEYQFEVRAQRRGYPPGEELTIPIRINRFWYNTVQARLFYLVFFVSLCVAAYRYRQKSRSQKLTESKLRSTEQQLHTVFQSTPMIMFALDRQGLVFIAEGKGFELAGIQPQKLIGQPAVEFIREGNIESHISRVLTGAVVQCEIALNGRVFQLRMVPLNGTSGEPGGVLAVGDDLTERIEMENQLITAREEYREAKTVAEKANQAKSMFLASMSHELRTPMNAILGFAQILSRDTAISEKNREYIQILHRSGEHLLSMINDVLDLSKIEAGRMEITEKMIDFLALIQELKAMFLLMAREKKLSFDLHCAPGVPRFLESDEGKLRQILINLIGNAIKYTSTGGISISISTVGTMLVVSVKDSGRGIPADQLALIFEPFRQVRGFNNKGTGLGLAISYRLAHLMKGRLEVTSQPGKGSDFRLYIPILLTQQDIRLDAETGTETTVTGIKDGKKRVVHVVDDVFENRALLRALLEPLGFVCLEAENGLEALRLLESGRPDAILMDIVMPEMDGREAVRIIRKREDCQTLPIIAITASGFEDERLSLLDSGFSAYLRKPFRDSELFDVLAKSMQLTWTYSEEVHADTASGSAGDPVQEVIIWLRSDTTSAARALRDSIETVDLNMLVQQLESENIPEVVRSKLLKEAKAANFRFFMDLEERLEEDGDAP